MTSCNMENRSHIYESRRPVFHIYKNKGKVLLLRLVEQCLGIQCIDSISLILSTSKFLDFNTDLAVNTGVFL